MTAAYYTFHAVFPRKVADQTKVFPTRVAD